MASGEAVPAKVVYMDVIAPSSPAFESGRLEFGCHVRIETLIYAMTAAGIEGAERLRNKPAGWIGIFEALGAHLAQDPSNYSISDAKEEFGMLYLKVIDKRTGRADTDLLRWCAEQSAVRCMVYGSPGRIRSELGWVMTLSDAAFDILVDTPNEQFLRLVYPVWRMDKDDVIEMIVARFATPAAAYVWYYSESLSGCGGRTAMQLVQEGKAQQVLDYLDAVDAGVFE
ncbi:hypothetical protein DSM14862_03773 (plasmid) [Sulfitobacter indolifex]|nr:hypothetical protein DSM14862_03334 [Sulfitobacter indolifex]UOA20935.1 hypothetical protein DSM14862_03773 [Sulfitobacter indolifex]